VFHLSLSIIPYSLFLFNSPKEAGALREWIVDNEEMSLFQNASESRQAEAKTALPDCGKNQGASVFLWERIWKGKSRQRWRRPLVPARIARKRV
jgi:hypothetical protein